MSKIVSILAVCFVLACTLTSCAKTANKTSAKGAPEFTLQDGNGQTVRLSDYKGKVVLLDFWATWCGPCKIEIPWFMEFEQQFKDRGFAVLGVSMDDDGWKVVNPYVKNMKINYRVLLGNDQVGALYGGLDSLPTTFLIDRQGKIVARHIGIDSGKEDFKNAIVQLLDAPRITGAIPARGALALLTSPR